MKIIVVIPAYNEAAKIFNVVQQIKTSGYEVVVVNDGSRDQTAHEALKAGAIVLQHFINRGYGAALATGSTWAVKNNYDVIVHFDADGQHEVSDITKLIKPITDEQVDVVLGSRFIDVDLLQRIPIMRKILLKAAIIFTWIFSGIKLTDTHNGLRAFSRAAIAKIDCRQDGMTYASEIIDQVADKKFRFCEVPVTIKYTDYSMAKGESNIKKVMLGLKFLWAKLIRD